jgi:hypothetical protein
LVLSHLEEGLPVQKMDLLIFYGLWFAMFGLCFLVWFLVCGFGVWFLVYIGWCVVCGLFSWCDYVLSFLPDDCMAASIADNW